MAAVKTLLGMNATDAPPDEISFENSIENKQIELENLVTETEQKRQIFCLYGSPPYVFRALYEELLLRGWLEYVPARSQVTRPSKKDRPSSSTRHQMTPVLIIPDATKSLLRCDNSKRDKRFYVAFPDPEQAIVCNRKIRDFGTRFEDWLTSPEPVKPKLPYEDLMAIRKIIQERNLPINFYWLSTKPDIQLRYFGYVPEVASRFQRNTFCSKIGLCKNFEKSVVYPSCIKFPVKYPRMYNVGEEKSQNNFFLDFYMTACVSLLMWFSSAVSKGASYVMESHGKVPARAIEYACRRCTYFLAAKKSGSAHQEEKIREDPRWPVYLYWYFALTAHGHKLEPITANSLRGIKKSVDENLELMKPYFSTMDTDGVLNLWIVKPYGSACGRGIFITNNLSYIKTLPQKYIVQKYIERPLLIENTKFDIRQWFLVTKLSPLEVWFYKESYLRFCSQPFNLRNLHPSIHLSNNAIQKHFANYVDLPCQNMWDSTTFQEYLSLIGFPDAWETLIYPGMVDAIICTLLHAQPTFEKHQDGWFEVFGADFMLTENIAEGPWLIEVNESPALDPSTHITSKMCEQMLRDVVKVVIDKKRDENADTGGWEFVFRQAL